MNAQTKPRTKSTLRKLKQHSARLLLQLINWIEAKYGEYRAMRMLKAADRKLAESTQAQEILIAVRHAYDKLFQVKGASNLKYQLGHVAVLLAKVRKLDPDTEVTITFDNGTPYRFSQNEFAAHLLWLEAKHFLDSFHLNREKLLNWYDNRSGNTDRDLEQFEHIKAQFNDAEKNLLPQARTAIEKALKYQPENFAFEKILVETMWYQGDRRAKKRLNQLLELRPDDADLIALKHSRG